MWFDTRVVTVRTWLPSCSKKFQARRTVGSICVAGLPSGCDQSLKNMSACTSVCKPLGMAQGTSHRASIQGGGLWSACALKEENPSLVTSYPTEREGAVRTRQAGRRVPGPLPCLPRRLGGLLRAGGGRTKDQQRGRGEKAAWTSSRHSAWCLASPLSSREFPGCS